MKTASASAVDFLPGDAAGDLFDLGRGELAGSLFVYGLAQQSANQRGSGDLLGEGAAAQLRVEFPVDAQVQRNVQRAGRLDGQTGRP